MLAGFTTDGSVSYCGGRLVVAQKWLRSIYFKYLYNILLISFFKDEVKNMPSIYENEEVMKVLSVSVDSAIKSMTKKVEPLDRPIGELSMFIRFLSTSYENDELLFLHSLTNFLASMYNTIKGRLEFTKERMLDEGRKDKEFEEVNTKIKEIDEKGKEIFQETLRNLKFALTKKEEKQIIDVFKKSHIRMVKEIVDKYGY